MQKAVSVKLQKSEGLLMPIFYGQSLVTPLCLHPDKRQRIALACSMGSERVNSDSISHLS